MRIHKPKVDPEAYFTCLDSFAGPLGGARVGDIRKGSDPLVTAHPGLFASGVLVGEDLWAARAA